MIARDAREALTWALFCHLWAMISLMMGGKLTETDYRWSSFCHMWFAIAGEEMIGARARALIERPRYFRLDQDGSPTPCTFIEWSAWFEFTPFEERVVVVTQVGEYMVSTVFLGIDHALDGPPEIFETMIFDRNRNDYGQWRYATRGDAWAGHLTAVGYAHTLPPPSEGDDSLS